jgi:hypothetical protein
MVMNDEQMMKLKSEENQLFLKMQRQLMDMTNFKDGTILDNIIQTNIRMSEQLNLKIDLRKETSMEKENEDEKAGKQKALEDKLDSYII